VRLDVRRAARLAIPAAEWLPGWRRFARRDTIAALAVWAVLVPQGMAYAALAGVPPVHGLYAALAGLVIYALLGTCAQLNVGPSSGVAVLSAATVAPLAAGDGDRYLALSAALALLTGGILLAAGLTRLGFVSEFLARPVLAGYFVGLALTIVVSQLPSLLGIPDDSSGFFDRLWTLMTSLDEVDRWTFAIGVGTLVALVVLRRVAPRAPGALIAVVLGVLLSRWFDLEADGVAVLGTFSDDLPSVGIPEVGRHDLQLLVAGAVGLALLAYAESIAAARQFSALHGVEVDPNRELIALGGANLGAGLAQGFPIDASVSRTSVADGAGQRSQLAGLLNAALILATILLLSSFFSDLPKATLAAVVIAAVLPLVHTGELRRLRRLDEVDFALGVICLLGVLLFGVLGGIVIAVLASLMALIYRSFRPNMAVLGRVRHDGDTDESFVYRDTSRHAGLETYPGLVIFRFDQEIFFANAALFRSQVRELVRVTEPPVKVVLVDVAAVTHVDTTGLDMLLELVAELRAGGVQLALARPKGHLTDILRRSGLLEVIGRERVFTAVHLGVTAFREGRL
jgi:SulP family sulfate permease